MSIAKFVAKIKGILDKFGNAYFLRITFAYDIEHCKSKFIEFVSKCKEKIKIQISFFQARPVVKSLAVNSWFLKVLDILIIKKSLTGM